MAMGKKRVTVTVDEELLDVAALAVQHGDAVSVSSWISEAMTDRYVREQRLTQLSVLIADYELEHGVISAAEIDEQRQNDRDAAALHRLTGASPPP